MSSIKPKRTATELRLTVDSLGNSQSHHIVLRLIRTSSRSTYYTHNAVSPNLTRSPVVGPYIATYAARPISAGGTPTSTVGSGTCAKPFATNVLTIASVRSGSTGPVARPFPPEITRAPAILTSATAAAVSDPCAGARHGCIKHAVQRRDGRQLRQRARGHPYISLCSTV